MKILRSAALLYVCALIPSSHGAQQSAPAPAPSVERDPQALALVQNSIAAMGGAAAVSQVQNCIVTGSSIEASTNDVATVTFTWTYEGLQFRLENDEGSATHILVSSGGSPQEFRGGAWFSAMPMLARTNLAYHVPALVLLDELSSPTYSIIYVGSTTLNGIAAVHIQTRDDSDALGHVFTVQDWYFDPTNGLPITVQYEIPTATQGNNRSPLGSMNFSEFKSVGGLLVPFRLQIVEGPASVVATVTNVAFNSNVSSSEFAPPSGGAQ
jgi:hypothetical protein